jgi:hypothetical protein
VFAHSTYMRTWDLATSTTAHTIDAVLLAYMHHDTASAQEHETLHRLIRQQGMTAVGTPPSTPIAMPEERWSSRIRDPGLESSY